MIPFKNFLKIPTTSLVFFLCTKIYSGKLQKMNKYTRPLQTDDKNNEIPTIKPEVSGGDCDD